jgi:hypothetical protein
MESINTPVPKRLRKQDNIETDRDPVSSSPSSPKIQVPGNHHCCFAETVTDDNDMASDSSS